MKKPVKTSVISVIVFTAALFVIYSCLNLSHRNITDNISENWLGVSDDTQDVSEYYIDQDLSDIQIQWNSGDVSVSSYDESDVMITETSDESLQIKQHLSYRVENGTLYISNGDTTESSLFHLSNPEVSCEVYIPSDMMQEDGNSLAIKTSQADVQIVQLSIPSLSVTTESGSVALENVSAGRLSVSTASGSVSSDSGTSDVIECTTQSGSIGITDTVNDLILKSTSGEITIAPAKIFMRADVSSNSGNIYLSVPKNNGLKMNIQNGSGSFDCELDVSSSNGYYIYKNGKIPLNIKTNSGDIEVYDAD